MTRFYGSSWDPIRALMKLQDEISRVFGDAERPLPFLAAPSATFPRVNVWTGPDACVLNAEVPGVSMDSIEVTVEGDTLTLKGERKPEDSVAPERYYRCERGHGAFGRSVRLPHRVDAASVQATLLNGILQVRLPKSPEEKPRKITVKS